MIDRQEKLWLIRQQIARAIAEVDHGDTPQSCLALANALGAMLSLLEAVNATQEVFNAKIEELHTVLNGHRRELLALQPWHRERAVHPKGEEVKEPEPTLTDKETREALDTLRAESTKIKRR